MQEILFGLIKTPSEFIRSLLYTFKNIDVVH